MYCSTSTDWDLPYRRRTRQQSHYHPLYRRVAVTDACTEPNFLTVCKSTPLIHKYLTRKEQNPEDRGQFEAASRGFVSKQCDMIQAPLDSGAAAQKEADRCSWFYLFSQLKLLHKTSFNRLCGLKLACIYELSRVRLSNNNMKSSLIGNVFPSLAISVRLISLQLSKRREEKKKKPQWRCYKIKILACKEREREGEGTNNGILPEKPWFTRRLRATRLVLVELIFTYVKTRNANYLFCFVFSWLLSLRFEFTGQRP